MGCVSSKIMTKSRSFREELSLSLQRRSNGMPVLENLLVSKNGGDQFLALLCTTNTVAKKLKGGTPTQESDKTTIPSREPTNPETIINTWELMAGLEEQEKEEEQKAESIVILPSRCSSEDNGLREAQVTDSSSDMGENTMRTTNFRTVEEFDTIVAENFVIESQDDVNKCSINLSAHVNGEEISTQQEVKLQHFSEGDSMDDPITVGTDEDVKVFISPDEHLNSELNCVNEAVVTVREGITRNWNLTNEKGLRRKAIAKELTKLKLPSFEFSSIGSLKEWLNAGGHVFSPGSYVTPKFGNMIPVNGDKDGEYSPFDPELVKDFEEAMIQMTMEEEHILKQIVDNVEEADTVENETHGNTL